MRVYEVFNYAPSPYTSSIQYIPDTTSKLVVPEQELLRDMLEHIARLQAYMLEVTLIQLLSSDMIHMTEGFRNFAENLLPLCNYLIANIDLYLRGVGVNVAKYLLDVYDLGEGEYPELKPFIEIHVCVRDIDEMLRIWESTVNYLRSMLGDDALEYVDVFFTRVR